MNTLSTAMREYLAEIYRLQEDSPTVSTTSLADRLNVSAPAVPRMLRRLANDGYVKHIPYQGVTLTKVGTTLALDEIRRHRILEVFLVNVMGFTWDEAHEHADDLTAGLNDGLINRMAEMTNHPTRCPHGEPIPDKDGNVFHVKDICLNGLTAGHQGAISRVRTHDLDKLQYFSSLNIVPDTRFEIIGRAPFNGPMSLRIDGKDSVLGVELAELLWVIPD